MPRPSKSRLSTPDDAEETRLLARSDAGDNAAPLSVSEISALLKHTVEDRFGFVRLRGELSGVKRAASGHLYCCLKDDKAVIDGVMWRTSAGRLGFLAEDGVEVVATGKLTTYPGRSKYQIVIESMEVAGEGALLALLERLKARLDAEGLFHPSRKRPLPFLPGVIGVVTSPTGAVIRDILHRLGDRFPSRVLVWPVMVQGQGSAEQVAAALRGFSAIQPGGPVPRPDVVIVARGGGSIEDLWSFNEEITVRAIAESTIPVISAVGHETDTTLSDHAADLRAPTPTAAAELAVPVRAELMAMLVELSLRKRRGVARPVALARERLAARAERLPDPRSLAMQPAQRLDELSERLRRALAGRAAHAGGDLARAAGALRPGLLAGRRQRERERLDAVRRRLAAALGQVARLARVELGRAGAPLRPAMLGRRIGEAAGRLQRLPSARALATRKMEGAAAQCAALARLHGQLDPRAPLTRGFAMVSEPGGAVVTSGAEAARHTALRLRFADEAVDVITTTTASGDAAPPDSSRKRRRPPKRGETPQQRELF